MGHRRFWDTGAKAERQNSNSSVKNEQKTLKYKGKKGKQTVWKQGKLVVKNGLWHQTNSYDKLERSQVHSIC